MSSSYESINAWLTQKCGQPAQLDEQGKCRLEASNDLFLNVFLPSGSQHVYVSVELMTLTAENESYVTKTAMQLNLFGQKTNGSILAVDPVSNQLILCMSECIDDLDFQLFSNILTNLVETAQSLIVELKEGETENLNSAIVSNLELADNFAMLQMRA